MRQSWAPAVFNIRTPTSSVCLTPSRHASSKIEHIEMGFLADVSESIRILRPRRHSKCRLNVSFLDGAQCYIPIAIRYPLRCRIGLIGYVGVAIVRVEIAWLNFWKIKSWWIAVKRLVHAVVLRHRTKTGKNASQCKREQQHGSKDACHFTTLYYDPNYRSTIGSLKNVILICDPHFAMIGVLTT